MTFYADLDQNTMVDAGSHIRAIGWLDDKRDFPTGKSPAMFVRKLRKFTQNCHESATAIGWPVLMGFHTCELCRKFMALGNVGVPAGDLLYVAPEMILHYVKKHRYFPPQQFIDTVLQSPTPRNTAYKQAVSLFRKLHKTYREW